MRVFVKLFARESPRETWIFHTVNERGWRIVFQAFLMQASREGFVQLLYAIILLQFGVIAVLLGGFSSEYLSNVYFRMWVNTTYPWLGPLLGGQIDALLVGVAAGATFLLVQRFRQEMKL